MDRRVGSVVGLIAGLAFVGAGVARAGDRSSSVDVTLSTATEVGAKTLQPGDYTFSWTGNGPQVEVDVKEHGKIVDEAKAKVVEEPKRADEQSTVTRNTKSGTRVLEELRVRGERTALEFTS
jgi:hypothetical protein